jgi:hypothetical protein
VLLLEVLARSIREEDQVHLTVIKKNNSLIKI